MIYLKEIATAQAFKIIPRSYVADSMIITNEYTNVATTYAITPVISSYYLEITKIVNLVEDNNYTLTVLNGTDVIYYGKIYCTNQVVADYSINNGDYVQHTSDNQYIIVE